VKRWRNRTAILPRLPPNNQSLIGEIFYEDSSMEQPTKPTNTNTDEATINQPGINSEPEPAPIGAAETAIQIENDESYKLVFSIEVSRRYNLHMARGFRRLGQLTKLFTIMGGSAAFVGLLNQTQAITPWVGLAGTFVLTFATALDIVYGFDAASFEHRKLARDYTDLLRRHKSGEGTKNLTQDYYYIEANEQAGLKAVMNASHNQALRNMGYTEDEYEEYAVKVRWWQYPLFIVF
jgi:hypothetical protein